MDYAQFLHSSSLGCPNILKILWRFSVMQLLTHDADLSAVEMGILHVSSLFSFSEASKPNASMSIESEDACVTTLPLSVHRLYSLPRSNALVMEGMKNHP